eukprot:s2272_g5.t1
MSDSGAAVDWKGQLLSFFQPQGQRDQVQFEMQRVGQEESEEKIFQAKVALPSGQVFLSYTDNLQSFTIKRVCPPGKLT